MLEEKYLGEDLPSGLWSYNGYCYNNDRTFETKYEHPNREFLVTRYLEELNAEVHIFNSEVKQEWLRDESMYAQ